MRSVDGPIPFPEPPLSGPGFLLRAFTAADFTAAQELEQDPAAARWVPPLPADDGSGWSRSTSAAERRRAYAPRHRRSDFGCVPRRDDGRDRRARGRRGGLLRRPGRPRTGNRDGDAARVDRLGLRRARARASAGLRRGRERCGPPARRGLGLPPRGDAARLLGGGRPPSMRSSWLGSPAIRRSVPAPTSPNRWRCRRRGRARRGASPSRRRRRPGPRR